MKNQLKALWIITQTFLAFAVGSAAIILASFYEAEIDLIRFSLLFIGTALVLSGITPMALAYVKNVWPKRENKTTKADKKGGKK